MKRGFNEEFEIQPTGLNNRVRVRVAGEADIELWIDYSFTFRSIREIDSAKKK